EGDPHLELVVVGQQGGVSVPDHRLEQVMAGVGEAVDVARRPPRVRLGGHPLDRALLPETPQGGVENVVVDRPSAQDPLDALLDLITVLRLIGEHPQHQYVEVHAVKLIYVRLTRNFRTETRGWAAWSRGSLSRVPGGSDFVVMCARGRGLRRHVCPGC